jgi:hypothetical protein
MKKFLGIILVICMAFMICVMPMSASAEDVDINMREYDTNGDDYTDLNDIVFLAQVAADWGVTYDFEACDINEDADINIVDVTYLARHFAGWSGY